MRYIAFILFLSFSSLFYAQTFEAGIQGGVNYNFSGDLTQIKPAIDDIIHDAKSIEGYHGGIWGQLNITDDLFLKSKLQYTQFQNNFSSSPTFTMKTKKIDIPVVIGMEVLGPLYLFAGPDFQYILSENFSVSDTDSNSDITYKDFTTGLHLGLGVEIGKIGLEVYWDKGISQQELNIINSEFVNESFTLDNRSNQIILSLQIALADSD